METYGTVKLSDLEKAVKQLKKQCKVMKVNDLDVTFEYLIGSFFPEVLDNIKDAMTKQYISGYNDGKGENKDDGSNV